MKLLLVFSATLALAFAYSEIDDSQDIELVVTNYDKLKAMLDCFLDKGPCDKFFEGFKKVLHDLVETACMKCTSTQKHMLKRMMEETKKQAPEYFKDMTKKYDPDGKYAKPIANAVLNF